MTPLLSSRLGGALLVAAFLLGPGCRPGASSTDAATGARAVGVSAASAVAPRIYGNVEPAVLADAQATEALPPLQGSETGVLTYAPEVPAPITRDYATRVHFDMEIVEVVKELADGVQYTFWTFGGETPGPMMRVREGDLVSLRVINHAGNKLPHNIDLHAVTGTGGGAEKTLVVPGREATVEWRALRPGLYVYHCATAPVGLHIANGMYGMILVEPKEGLSKVDREYYIMQSEFYTKGAFKEAGLQDFDLDRALREDPTYVVFNGGVDALTGARALQASVGETVRFYVGNGGPNLASSFHLIGEIFDRVYGEGGTLASQHNVQTTNVPPGGSAMVEFKTDVPGTFLLVDHAIFRAFNKGAIGQLKVVGPENTAIYRSVETPAAPEAASTASLR